jgi:PEP-CTERM motif
MHLIQLKKTTLAAAALVALTCGSASAATYAAGDLLIGFVAAGGTGADTTLVANLGSAAAYRDRTTDNLSVITLGTQLSATFGSTWYERSDLYVSLLAARSSSPTSSTLVNGDPARTLYASQPRSAVGIVGEASSTIPSLSNFNTPAVAMVAVATRFSTSAVNGTWTIPDSLANTIDEFTRPTNPVSYDAYQSSVEQTFSVGTWGTIGLAGSVEAALDLYRNQARNDIATQSGFGEPVGPGTFEGTFTVDQSGQVAFLAAVPEPGSVLMLGLAGLGGLLRRRRH